MTAARPRPVDASTPSSPAEPGTRVFGIRHHGPGSAKSLRAAFDAWRPEVVLVEGPPDADGLLAWAGRPDMKAPVALMIYDPTAPGRAAFFPFAEFSPEWVAIRWALAHGAELRFMDLPMAHQMALDVEGWGEDKQEELLPATDPPRDPLGLLAQAAGDGDGEQWWGRVVEEQSSDEGAFEAITEAMGALRSELEGEGRGSRDRRRETLREAYMRKVLRSAERGRSRRIAAVVGAWHAPALIERPPASTDNHRLRKLPRRKVAATWVAWSHGRLARVSGYGAGVEAPGWYAHLFRSRGQVAQSWLTMTARLLREEGFDVPPASVIDAVRLAEALAALRDRPRTGLDELRDATVSTFLRGRGGPLVRIDAALNVGEALGELPEGTPEVPLATDLRQAQKSLRLAVTAKPKEIVLDLREERGRAKSALLRRLELLDIPWGRGGERVDGRGTFKESWTLAWAPELALRVVDAAQWGNTVESAAVGRAESILDEERSLPKLVATAEKILLADLPSAMPRALRRIDRAAAGAADVGLLADAVPSLARMARYGDARGTKVGAMRTLFESFLGRVVAGLVAASVGLAPEPAEALANRIDRVDGALRVLDDRDQLERWWTMLARLVGHPKAAALGRGRAARRLLDADVLRPEQARRHLERALARGTDPAEAARWLEGFVGGSVLLLLHDPSLLAVLDVWIAGLDEAAFEQVLPVLRRTFSDLGAPERRRLGQRLRSPAAASEVESELDPVFAEAGLAVAARLLGLPESGSVGGDPG